jgi:hypothetical protein
MTNRPTRIQLRRAKGWRMPENTVKVDRTTPLGNPFAVGRDGNQAYCVQLHRDLMGGFIALTAKATIESQQRHLQAARVHLPALRGKNLACWCALGSPCHADTLLEIANA